MPSPDSVRKGLSKRRLRYDVPRHDRVICAFAIGQEREYTLFNNHTDGLLADEHRLLHQAEAVCHSRCVDYRCRIRDASADRRFDDRYLDFALVGDDDIPRNALFGLHQTKRRLSYLRANGHQTSCVDYGLQQDLHQRGYSDYRFSHTGLLYHVHHVARSY